MPIVAVCPSCGARIKAPEALIGKKVNCPGCQDLFLVKAAASTAVAAVPARSAARSASQPAARSKAIAKQPRTPVIEEEDEDYPEEKSPRIRHGEVSDGDMTSALLLHLSSFILGGLGPLLLWLIKRKDSRFVDFHGRSHLNSLLTFFLLALGIMIVGFPVAAMLGFAVGGSTGATLGVVVSVLTGMVLIGMNVFFAIKVFIAAFKAKNGEWYRLPAMFRPFGDVT